MLMGMATALDREKGVKQFRYLDFLINIFVVVLIVSNLIAPKFVKAGIFRFSAAQLLFPITYIFGDVFTEVYGYSASRRAIWTGFMASGIMVLFGLFAVLLPPAPEFKDQKAYETIFGVVPRNVMASLLAYWAGEFANSLTVAKMKLWTNGEASVDTHGGVDHRRAGGRYHDSDCRDLLGPAAGPDVQPDPVGIPVQSDL